MRMDMKLCHDKLLMVVFSEEAELQEESALSILFLLLLCVCIIKKKEGVVIFLSKNPQNL